MSKIKPDWSEYGFSPKGDDPFEIYKCCSCGPDYTPCYQTLDSSEKNSVNCINKDRRLIEEKLRKQEGVSTDGLVLE